LSSTTRSPMVIRPRSGWPRPATARRSVVLPLPEAPSSATIEPRLAVNEQSLRMCWPPSHLSTFSTTSSVMDPCSELERHDEAQGGHDDAGEGEGRDGVHGSGLEQGDHERADQLGPRGQD